MRTLSRCLAVMGLGVVLCSQTAGAQQVASSSRPVLLDGADLYTVSHGVIPAGQLLIRDGRIAALGARVEVPVDAERIDLAGKRIYPGLIAANTTLGLVEFGAIPASRDYAEIGENNADLKVEVAVDPDTEHWPVARSGGVLSALVVPQVRAGGLIAGQSALMKPQGWTGEDMTVASGVGMHLYWPTTPVLRQRLDQLMEAAQRYRVATRAPGQAPDLRLAALEPVLAGRMPLFVHASRVSAIREALAFARTHRLRMVLVGGSDAAHLAEVLAEHQVPVILGGGAVRRWEGFAEGQAAAATLARAGVPLVIASGYYANAMGATRLPATAATYASYGLGDEAALRAITLSPAEAMGVADRLGSLEVGKSATLFVASDDILLSTTGVERLWIDGRAIDVKDNHHERLYRKYQAKYAGQPKE